MGHLIPVSEGRWESRVKSWLGQLMNDTTRAPAAAIAGRTFFRWLAGSWTTSPAPFYFHDRKKKRKKPFTCLSQNVASLLFCLELARRIEKECSRGMWPSSGVLDRRVTDTKPPRLGQMTLLLPPTHLLTWVGNLTKVKNREKLWLISICVHHENKRKPKSRDYSLDFHMEPILMW